MQRCCLQLLICWIVTVIVIANLHRFTCLFSIALCSPVWNWLSRVDRMYVPTNFLLRDYSVEQNCDPKRYPPHPDLGDRSFGILLATPKSGSTWVETRLTTNPEIYIGSEWMLELNRACKLRAFSDPCTWADYAEQLEKGIDMVAGQRKPGRVPPIILGFKVQYDHIPEEFRNDFAQWLNCREAFVIHLVRGAAIESFWTQQAQLMDFAQLGEAKDRFAVNEKPDELLLSNHKPLYLDPPMARAFVDGVESHRELYRRLLHFQPRVKYIEVLYEDLTGAFAQSHWDALNAFLGAGFRDSERDKLTRVHPGTCGSKIANCREVREALKGTISELACNWYGTDHAKRLGFLLE
jgi:hypothetical protein